MNDDIWESVPSDLADTYRMGVRRVPLTNAQLGNLELLAAGLTSSEAAICLGVVAETVRSHRKHLIERLGATNSTHAVAIAFLTGILPRTLELEDVSDPDIMAVESFTLDIY